MSFILDALKKSEAERQRRDAPGIASIPASGQQQPGNRWAWIIGGLLAVNLLVLAAIMLKPDGDGTAATGAAVAPAAEPAAPETFSEIVREVRQRPPQTVAEESPSAAQPAVTQAGTEPASPAPRQTISEGLKTFNELRVAGLLQLPDMHIDIHVYSGTPADRFVFVNMTKYRENSTLTEGPVVSEITPDGVVLSYQGMRFLLPRE